ncbi:MAG TPA: DUF1326 domain-containing protein [Candidatus Acidoferrales bacterium]|nr:DUF1326 domain-containing protein [Candidatus Acidoferrales bacterium]
MGEWRAALLVITFLALGGTAGAKPGAPATAATHWEIAGTLTEACTCAVPCTCNFGEGPSPHHYCWTVFSLRIDKGRYGDLKLDSLHLAVGHAQKMWVAYIDDRASPAQSAALRVIATRVLKDTPFRGQFETAHITQEIGDRSARVQIGKYGGFETNYIIGLDRKTPVVVENNTTFNIPRSTKTKTSSFRYQDAHGNDIDTAATNGNQGKFDWTDRTPAYLK